MHSDCGVPYVGSRPRSNKSMKDGKQMSADPRINDGQSDIPTGEDVAPAGCAETP